MQQLAREIRRLLEPLEHASQSLDALVFLLEELGWRTTAREADWNAVRSALGFVSGIDDFLDAAADLAAAEEDAEVRSAVQRMLEAAGPLLADLGRAGGAPPSIGPFDRPEFWRALGEDLFGYLVHRYLSTYRPGVGGVLEFLGVVTVDEKQGDVPYRQRRVHLDRIPRMFYDVPGLLAMRYGWGEPDDRPFDAIAFLDGVRALVEGFGAHASWGIAAPTLADAYYAPDSPHREFVPALSVLIHRYLLGDVGAGGLWLGAAAIPPAGAPRAAPRGITIYPIVVGASEARFRLTDSLEVALSGAFSSDGAVRLDIRPSGLDVSFAGDAVASVDAAALLAFGRDTPTILLGSAAGSNLQLLRVELEAGVSGPITALEPSVRLDVTGGKLTIAGGSGDGFLQKLLPPDGIEASLDFGVDWSAADGLQLRGSAGLELTLPIHQTFLDVIKLESIYLAIGFNSAGVPVMAGLTGGVELGPIQASIQRIGVIAELTFPESGGNLGKADLSLGFLPPTGAGLSLDAGGLAGGGFVEFDDANKRYAGVLGLTFGEIGLVAIGLITTRMPDGSDGFALLINIGVTFDPAIQLSMGFTLAGVGGLVGVNRTMEVEVLQAGIRNRTLDSILFPDPSTVVANADRIISDMRTVFPPAEGRFVVGPMVKIGYGTPPIVTADIGVFLELPDPIRVVLMGQVEARFPEPESPVIEIHLDVLGVLDFEKRQLTFQASIYDSRVLTFTVAGDSAFLLGWGDDARFALSLGGFHPKFDPPPPPIIFSGLRRLSIGISAGSDFQLTCEAYNALTPNSLQFGARVDLFAGSGDACVAGFMGMDALIYFSPFSFEVWIGAAVRIRVAGTTLADVYLSFTLSGPDAWSARGTAKIKVLFIDIDVSFSERWGRPRAATLPARDPWGPLLAALAEPGNWSGALPAGTGVVETLRERKGEPAGPAVVHPGGRIEVRQRIVPLGIRLDKVSNAPIRGYDRFTIEGLEVGGETLEVEPVEEFFARGQFVDLSDAQRLSVPAFERLQAGVRGAAAASLRAEGALEVAPAEYESIVIDDDRVATKTPEPGVVDWTDAQSALRSSAVRRAVRLRGPHARFVRPHAQARVRCGDERYCVANAADLTRATLDASVIESNRDLSRVAADQALASQRAIAPADELIVLPEYELQGVP